MWLVLAGCFTTVEPRYDVCDLALTTSETEVAPGDTLVVSGGPLTDRRDTIVRVDGRAVAVSALSRTDLACAACLACRQETDCGACATCVGCVEVCTACEESFEVVIPDDLPEGSTVLSVVNAYGSGAVALQVVDPDGPPDDTATDP